MSCVRTFIRKKKSIFLKQNFITILYWICYHICFLEVVKFESESVLLAGPTVHISF